MLVNAEFLLLIVLVVVLVLGCFFHLACGIELRASHPQR